MKNIIAATLIACALLATPAHAVTRFSYNPSSFSPIRIIGQWAIGNQRIALSTHDFCVNGQKRFAVTEVWRNHFTGEITVNVVSHDTGVPCQ